MKYVLMVFSLLLLSFNAHASADSDALLAQYKAAGAANFDAERGKEAWTHEVKSKEGEMRSCTTCHGKELTKPGKHATTEKVIDPMAPSVNKDRYTDQKKIEKWFKRNCEWAWGRECTPQEKGDLLKFLLSR